MQREGHLYFVCMGQGIKLRCFVSAPRALFSYQAHYDTMVAQAAGPQSKMSTWMLTTPKHSGLRGGTKATWPDSTATDWVSLSSLHRALPQHWPELLWVLGISPTWCLLFLTASQCLESDQNQQHCFYSSINQGSRVRPTALISPLEALIPFLVLQTSNSSPFA